MIANRWFISVIAGLAAFGGVTYEFVDRRAKLADLRHAEERRSLAVDTLSTAVTRYISILPLAAESRIVTDLLGRSNDPSQQARANEFLERSAHDLGLSALYVLDTRGKALAASNWREPTTFVGHDYSFRPYFRDAMAHGTARYFGVGVTSGQPGLFLATEVRDEDSIEPIGVVVAKVDFAPLEESWTIGGERIFVADEDNVVILTTVARARYRAVAPLPRQQLQRLAEEQRYADHSFGEPLSSLKLGGGHSRAGPVPGTGWTLFVEVGHGERRWQPPAMAAIAVLTPLVTGLGFLSWRQRRGLVEAERRAMPELEVRVAERTADLKTALARLECEIVQRQKIDLELHRTRDELVVAAKLAAIGRAFSSLAHEVNQPLAALKTHLHSARLLIERQDSLAAIDNIVEMLAAVDRLTALTGDLKRLAYQGNGERRPTDLCDVVHRVAGLVRFRLADAGISFDATLSGSAMVLGSPGRLEQVVLNLLLNAMDAVAEQPIRRVRIEMGRAGETIELVVIDNGPGVPESDRPRLFEPFFTTKPEGVGLGLGLGVSHTIVKDHGGTLTYGRSAQGESRFVVALPALNGEG